MEHPPHATVRRGALRAAGVLLVLALGCGGPEAVPPDAAAQEIASAIDATPPRESDAAAPAPPEAEAPRARTPDAPLPPEAVKPLADLLRLPASGPTPAEEPEGDPLADAEAATPSADGSDASTGTRNERLFGVQFESRTDESQLIKDRARTQTDAGVSVKTGKDTRLRGGVRVEQESGREREAPVPTVGIEKRF